MTFRLREVAHGTRQLVWACRVLVVDGYPDSAESMALVREIWGYQPLVVLDGITGQPHRRPWRMTWPAV